MRVAPRLPLPFRRAVQTRLLSTRRIVFLGTPAVSAFCLDALLAGSELADFEISAVVTQPPGRKGRGKKIVRSPVHALAASKGIPVYTPDSAKETEFIEQMRNLRPDLCVTAAYGQFLPRKFLDVPRFGTLNVHPSLLPQYRGAAPVQRSIQEGTGELGVSVAMTVLKMDAGPILKQWRCDDNKIAKAPAVELLLVITLVVLHCFAFIPHATFVFRL